MQLQKRKPKGGAQNKKSPRQKKRGVLYIKHLPHGFFEEQLRGYFSQFGAITRLRLARSKRTLGSKGYAFIEFRYPEVAEIAADAMNNYLMFKNLIKTRFIPPNDIRHDYFRSSVSKIKVDGEKVFTSKSIQAREAVVQNTNKLMTTEDEAKRVKKIGAKLNKAKKRLVELGIDFDVDEIAQNMGDEVMQAAEKSKPKTITDVDLPSEDEADETFDPQNVDIDSEDDFEDFEYDSENSDDENGEEVSIDKKKVEEAVKIARKASKTAKIPEILENPKRKGAPAAEPTTPAKKQKKGKENKQIDEVKPKPAKKPTGKQAKAAEKQVVVAETASAPTKVSKRNATKKEEAVVVEAPKPKQKTKKTKAATADLPTVTKEKADKKEAPAAAPKQKNAKKEAVKITQADKTEAPVVVSKQKNTKKPAAKVQQADATTKPKAKGKKAKQSESPVKSAPASKKGKKAAVPQPSSLAPVKTKKLAKASAGIEKKKPAKVADKKLKLAAGLTANSADVVKVVKGKELKKKTKK